MISEFENQDNSKFGGLTMKKICEIYDVSQEYEMKENSVLVCVGDLDQDKLFSIIPELKKNFNKVFNNDEWQQYL